MYGFMGTALGSTVGFDIFFGERMCGSISVAVELTLGSLALFDGKMFGVMGVAV